MLRHDSFSNAESWLTPVEIMYNDRDQASSVHSLHSPDNALQVWMLTDLSSISSDDASDVPEMSIGNKSHQLSSISSDDASDAPEMSIANKSHQLSSISSDDASDVPEMSIANNNALQVWMLTDLQWTDALDQCCLWRILGIRWHDCVRNADIHHMTNQPPLSSTVTSLRLSFFEHLVRMDENADAS